VDISCAKCRACDLAAQFEMFTPARCFSAVRREKQTARNQVFAGSEKRAMRAPNVWIAIRT